MKFDDTLAVSLCIGLILIVLGITLSDFTVALKVFLDGCALSVYSLILAIIYLPFKKD